MILRSEQETAVPAVPADVHARLLRDADFQNAPMSVNTYKARTENAQKIVHIYTYIYTCVNRLQVLL